MPRLGSRILDLKEADSLANQLLILAETSGDPLLLLAANMMNSLTAENRSLRYHGITKQLVNPIFRRILSEIVREAISHELGQALINGEAPISAAEDHALFLVGLVSADTNYLRFWNNVFMSHETGNDVLKITARTLENTIASLINERFTEGLPFHVGGDEFFIILDGCSRGNEYVAMSAAYCLLDQFEGIDGVELPVSASFGCSHLVDAISLFVQMCEMRPDLFPQNQRDVCTILMQMMEWTADTRSYLAKTVYRLLLLKKLAETYRISDPDTYDLYWGFLHEGTHITVEELAWVEEHSDDEATDVATAIALGHFQKIVEKMYSEYDRIGRVNSERKLMEILVKEVVCGLPASLPQPGEAPRSRGLITF